jgi:hypothetical protein
MRLVVVLFTLLAFAFSGEPTPFGLKFGRSTFGEALEALRAYGVKNLKKEDAYLILMRTPFGFELVFETGREAEILGKAKAYRLKELTALTGQEIPPLGKNSKVYLFFYDNKLVSLRYIALSDNASKGKLKIIRDFVIKKYNLRRLGIDLRTKKEVIEKNFSSPQDFMKILDFEEVYNGIVGNTSIILTVLRLGVIKSTAVSYIDISFYSDMIDFLIQLEEVRRQGEKSITFDEIF